MADKISSAEYLSKHIDAEGLRKSLENVQAHGWKDVPHVSPIDTPEKVPVNPSAAPPDWVTKKYEPASEQPPVQSAPVPEPPPHIQAADPIPQPDYSPISLLPHDKKVVPGAPRPPVVQLHSVPPPPKESNWSKFLRFIGYQK